MKEIKAYVRRSRVNQVVEALLRAWAPGITVVEVHPVGRGFDPRYFDPLSGEDVIRSDTLFEVVKVELVCVDQDVERLVQVMLKEAQTGAPGDGLIFVSEVTKAVRVRDGASGEEILARSI